MSEGREVGLEEWQKVAKEVMPGIDWEKPKYLALSTEVIEGVMVMGTMIAQLRDEARQERIRGAVMRHVVEMLVNLKEYKDKNGKTETYLNMQPGVWQRAKEALEHLNGKEILVAVRNAGRVLLSNHKHHQEYDDYGGYPDSEMSNDNEEAISELALLFGKDKDEPVQTTTE